MLDSFKIKMGGGLSARTRGWRRTEDHACGSEGGGTQRLDRGEVVKLCSLALEYG